jgi:NAD(P)-dependent dehydrogenase (short-subunit alcohol dehydrogenase family)
MLSGRRALVTGAARGIGLAIAAGLHRAGAAVALCDVDEGVVEAAAALDGAAAVTAGVCDVRRSDDVDAFVARAAGELGGIDVLVNNAGILGTGRLADSTDAEWERILDVNLMGAFRATRAVLPGMLERGFGRVISLASITPLRGEARTTAYAASKGGLIGMTKSLSREVAHRGVTVNAVAPGYVLTDQTAEVFGGEHGDAIRAQITMRDFGRADDIAGAVSYLASDAARYVTGHVLVVDGGVV